MQIALVGWQSSGKSTLFTALTGIEPAIGEAAHSGISGVPDGRIDDLHKLYPPAKKIYAKIEYIDLAGVAHDD
ncbi:50S ribosome-binding GTPase, partial [bacterium]|nr:50S ribosome-binding GTPase [bacterium]